MRELAGEQPGECPEGQRKLLLPPRGHGAGPGKGLGDGKRDLSEGVFLRKV